ncbi:terminase [Kitasatospora kifunensis]|uniref:Terminase n=1 Tax=Kitasatospora kifunensis TaxID=58351 RepID=A0A7W7VZ85_KITKI|nr:terminase [Kitasatospora kifunensis]MBB4928306.1 hypothetical protein [Kitasatospora kifunensis]
MDIDGFPSGLGDRASQMWAEVTEQYDLGAHEKALLEEVCRTMTDLDVLHERVTAQGHTIAGRVNPELVEARQMRIAFARLVAALRLPEDDTDAQPQRRVGVRGSYRLGGAS